MPLFIEIAFMVQVDARLELISSGRLGSVTLLLLPDLDFLATILRSQVTLRVVSYLVTLKQMPDSD